MLKEQTKKKLKYVSQWVQDSHFKDPTGVKINATAVQTGTSYYDFLRYQDKRDDDSSQSSVVSFNPRKLQLSNLSDVYKAQATRSYADSVELKVADMSQISEGRVLRSTFRKKLNDKILKDHEKMQSNEEQWAKEAHGINDHDEYNWGEKGSNEPGPSEDVVSILSEHADSQISEHESAVPSQDRNSISAEKESSHEGEQPQGVPKPSPKEKEKEKEDDQFKVLDEYKKRLEEDDKTVFYDMFKLLITKMSEVQQEITLVKSQQKTVSEKVSQLEAAISFNADAIDNCHADLDEIASTNIKLVETTIACEQKVGSIASNVNRIASEVNRGQLLIYGIQGDIGDRKEKVVSFFTDVLKVTKPIMIQSAHKIGKKVNAPVWCKLTDPDDIATVFSCVSNLKDQKNSAGKTYRIKEFLSEANRDRSNRHADIIAENRRLPVSHQVTVKRRGENLYINGDKYEKAVTPPPIKEVLLASEEDLSLKKDKIHSSAQKCVKNSTFQAYIAEATSFEKVKEIYMKIKAKHLSATHIACAYRIFGSRFYNLQDYSDDGEHKAGSTMLNVLKTHKLWNMAVFIVRYHEGPNLGKLRFQIIEEMTSNVIASYPRALNYGQHFRDTKLLKIMSKVEEQRVKDLKKWKQKTTSISDIDE